MYSFDQLQKASDLLFFLLKRKVLETNDPKAAVYEEEGIKEILSVMAQSAGLSVHSTGERVHLVANPVGSIFANSITHLKEKYKKVENREYLHMIYLLILLFLYEVDQKEEIHWELEGVAYRFLAEKMTSYLDRWKKINEETEQGFSDKWKLNVTRIYEIWNVMDYMPESKSIEESEDSDTLYANRRTQIGVIHSAMVILRDEKLINIDEQNRRILPRKELHERMKYIYHDSERLQELKNLFKETEQDSYATY